MIHPEIHGALGHQRTVTLLAQAEAGRRARQARPIRPPAAVYGAAVLSRVGWWVGGVLAAAGRGR